ncbi:MAG TPA: homoserine kinase [Thermoanaerobaculia bacterium]|nr:homoserine kinase [Thermoanaerobaculia bacterium]
MMRKPIATAFAPGSIANLGPGFDVLGLAVDGIGDRVTVELTDRETRIADVTGLDSDLIPRDPKRNVAAIAAMAWLRAHDDLRNVIVTIDKGLPMSGGLGGSAASSVAGAWAAAAAAGADSGTANIVTDEIVAAALEGEATVSGRHIDNIAPSVFGGLTLVRSVDPIDIVRIEVHSPWWVALVTPNVRIETKSARSILPDTLRRSEWIQQMANTSALAIAFSRGDGDLVRRALDDRFAEPRRAPLIPHFGEVKNAALRAGAFGCSISGSGPTVFAVACDAEVAQRCRDAMQQAFRGIDCLLHVSAIATRGARVV